MSVLFEPVVLGALSLRNRVVMAPMTRSRAAEGDMPTGYRQVKFLELEESRLRPQATALVHSENALVLRFL
jgi:hypothetical protein